MACRFSFAALLLSAVTFFAGVAPVAAQGGDPFQVRDIAVDVTAANVGAAKEQALVEAQRRGFQTLLERLTGPNDRGRLPATVDGRDFVSDYAIDDEHSSRVRYVATLSVRYNPTAVRRLLRGANITIIEPVSRTVVVLPVWRMAGQSVLWEDPNPWRQVWLEQGTGTLVTTVVPDADGPLPSGEQAVGLDPTAFAALGGRYHTMDVMVAQAELSGDGRKLDVALSSLPGVARPFDQISYAAKSGETPGQLEARAVRDVVQQLEAMARSRQANTQATADDTMSVIAKIDGLDNWLAFREHLERVGLVRSWELVSLTRTEAALILHMNGDPEKTRNALGAAGLDVQPGEGYWTMTVATERK